MLVIVLWIAFGLVVVALYFADSMSAGTARVGQPGAGLLPEQAIEGAARYVARLLTAFATTGVVPIPPLPCGSRARRRRPVLDHRPRSVTRPLD